MKKHAKKIITALLVVAMLVPTVAMIFSSAADNRYPVELAFNNLFVFDEWANNDLSTTIMPQDADEPYGKLEADIESGSFTITKYKDAPASFGGIYTAHGMDAEDADNNANYYAMNVKPNATYRFSYTLANSTISGFIAYVFYFDESNKFIKLDPMGATNLNGANSWEFTTPDKADHIQIRFTVANDAKTTAVSTDVKDIMIYRIEAIAGADNLFDFATWSTKTGSGGGDSVYAAGTRTINADEQSVTLTSNGIDNLGNCSSFLTGFALGAYDNTHFTIDTQPGKTYSLSYELVNTTLDSVSNATVLIPWYNSSNTWIGSYGDYAATQKGTNTYTFTVPADVYHFQVVVGIYDWSMTNGKYATIKDIELRETSVIEHTADPHRIVYTYDHSSADENFYGELSTPTYVPEGYVFGGWYTGENGEGERITPETKIKYNSFTVYPKYERKVDSIEIATMPTKTVYTVGEKLNTSGLTLKATVNNEDGTTSSFNINSDIYCTPAYLDTAGEQTITAHYGGKTATFKVTVLENNTSDVVVNSTVMKDVAVTNNKYTLNCSAEPFNRYKITYYSDAYVRGIITFEDGLSEEFFLEPSDNGTFTSLIDNFLDDERREEIKTIEFTCLDNELGNFQLKAVTTDVKAVPANSTAFYTNKEYMMGIDIRYGGVVSELYDTDDEIVARVYDDPENRWYTDEDGNTIYRKLTLVDYEEQLNDREENEYKGVLNPTGETSDKVNLINTLDRGRYLQQSYYGTSEKPYVQGEFNRSPWKYNPVQGGNVGEEPSKVIDYEITDTYVYVKARPMEWEKWSDDHAKECEHTIDVMGEDGKLKKVKAHEPTYGNDVVSDTYVEAWYYFEDGMIKVTNRKVDYSGLPEANVEQEMPALYLIEPLNNFVYNDVEEKDAWATTNYDDLSTIVNEHEPEFWGIVKEYNDYHYLEDLTPETDTNDDKMFDVFATCNENWAAFTASEDPDSFGVGIYTPGATELYYGVMPQIYAEIPNEEGGYDQSSEENYRHAETVNPSPEMPTSYIAPLKKTVFKSYDPTTYTYYLTTGTAEEIRGDFGLIGDKEAAAELEKSKIAVPETVYLNPADNLKGLYYVNNILNEHDFYNVETEAVSNDTDMYFGLHVKDAKSFKVNVTNVSDSTNDIILGNGDGTGNREGEEIGFDSSLIDAVILENDFSLRLTKALNPNQTATAKWEITVTFEGGTTETYTAYTVLYAPERTVGAVAEARQVDASQNEISSWITGANGVDHSQRAPLGSFHGDMHNSGYFKADPLYNDVPSGGSGGTSNDYIFAGSDYDDNSYVLQTATNGHDGSRAQSYLGLLTVDKSRYTNTDQIPNLRIGYDVLRKGSYTSNSIGKYTTYYTLGTTESYTSTSLSAAPSGWTTYSGTYTDFADNHSIPYRESFVPSFDVSEIDGKYIHALNQAKADQTINTNQYSTAGTSVLCSVTDKSGLRDAVLNAYVSTDLSDDFIEKLENAATILGDPSATQAEIDEARRELTEVAEAVYYALKYDNLFSAYEYSLKSGSMTANRANASVEYLKDINGIKVTSDNVDNADVSVGNGNNPDTYYNIDVKGSTEYIFEYDVESTKRSQLHLFFFDTDSSTPSAWLAPTNRTYTWTPEGGATQNHTQSSGDFANVYADGNGHVVMRFTTPANADRMAFRFGNTESVTMSSTFSNIKLVEANKYYADVEYTKTEDVYKEFDSYGTLQTLSRTGYTFGGWKDAEGNTVTETTVATEHKSIYSVWEIINYTITYDANGGNISPSTKSYTIEDTLTLPTPSRDGYVFQGWKVTESDGSWAVDGLCPAGEVPAGMYGNVTLTAQWSLSEIPVYFDTILDFDDWNTKTANNATISNVTANGFTLTSNVGAGEGTSTSPEFPVTPGKQYYIDIDVTDSLSTPKWDVYIFFYDENTHSGTGLAFSDGKNRFSGDGNGVASRTFTAPSGAVNAVIRLDANEASHSVTFSDIRVYEAGTRAANVNVPDSSRTLQYGETFGTLPVPTREGFTFKGWFDENGNQVTAESTVNYTSAVYLKSKWVINNSSLVSDEIVIDFGSPVSFAPLANDTAFMNAAKATGNSYKFLGFSKEGSTALNGTYGAFSISGENVTYTPSKTVDGVETVTYYASLTENGVATTVESTITVAPASNVLYEENRLAVSNQNGVAWSTVKEESVAANGNQAVSDKNDVYGYDKSYATAKTYSNNSALSVSLTNAKRTSQNLSFDFTGTGFDLYSACGPTTGIQILTVKNSEGKATHAAIVDTYYSDSNYGTLYQVPIVSIRDLDYGSYTVQVAASYLTFAGALNNASSQSVSGQNGMMSYTAPAAGSQMLYDMLAELGMTDAYEAEEFNVIWFDENSIFNGGSGASASSAQNEKSSALSAQVKNASNGAAATADEIALINVIDSFRVYNPIENGDDYYIASEKGAQYYNVMDNLINGGIVSGEGQFAYVSGKDQEAISPDTYDAIGPKDELYLSPRTGAVVFSIGEFNKESSRVMVSLRAASGTPNVKIGGVHHEVTSNTEMYYDISEYVAPDGTVTIENGGSGNSLLAVGTVKITGTAVTMLSTFNLDTVRAMIAAPSVEVDLTAPKAEEEVTPPEDDTNPGDDTNVDDTNDGNGNTDDGSDKKCSIMQFFLWLIELFKKILSFISNIFSI